MTNLEQVVRQKSIEQSKILLLLYREEKPLNTKEISKRIGKSTYSVGGYLSSIKKINLGGEPVIMHAGKSENSYNYELNPKIRERFNFVEFLSFI